MIAVLRHQDGAARVHLPNQSAMAVDLDEIVGKERTTDAQQYAGEEILGNIAESETYDYASNAGAADHGQSKPRQSCNL